MFYLGQILFTIITATIIFDVSEGLINKPYSDDVIDSLICCAIVQMDANKLAKLVKNYLSVLIHEKTTITTIKRFNIILLEYVSNFYNRYRFDDKRRSNVGCNLLETEYFTDEWNRVFVIFVKDMFITSKNTADFRSYVFCFVKLIENSNLKKILFLKYYDTLKRHIELKMYNKCTNYINVSIVMDDNRIYTRKSKQYENVDFSNTIIESVLLLFETTFCEIIYAIRLIDYGCILKSNIDMQMNPKQTLVEIDKIDQKIFKETQIKMKKLLSYIKEYLRSSAIIRITNEVLPVVQYSIYKLDNFLYFYMHIIYGYEIEDIDPIICLIHVMTDKIRCYSDKEYVKCIKKLNNKSCLSNLAITYIMPNQYNIF